jgi:response regulator RpfG family c-di-GMP phosphodiesterase
MLFAGYADLDAIIAAINQGHIFRFIKKPWQPEELEAAVREAAGEYDQIVRQDEELQRLNEIVNELRQRVTALEQELKRLRKE